MLRTKASSKNVSYVAQSLFYVKKFFRFLANVLPLIPTIKARQRNFLQGKIGANSLLGPTELDRVCPNREVTIFVGTWNMNGHSPPKYDTF